MSLAWIRALWWEWEEGVKVAESVTGEKAVQIIFTRYCHNLTNSHWASGHKNKSRVKSILILTQGKCMRNLLSSPSPNSKSQVQLKCQYNVSLRPSVTFHDLKWTFTVQVWGPWGTYPPPLQTRIGETWRRNTVALFLCQISSNPSLNQFSLNSKAWPHWLQV